MFPLCLCLQWQALSLLHSHKFTVRQGVPYAIVVQSSSAIPARQRSARRWDVLGPGSNWAEKRSGER